MRVSIAAYFFCVRMDSRMYHTINKEIPAIWKSVIQMMAEKMNP